MMDNALYDALQFAMKAHKGQIRKFQDVPYVWHPISVAKLVELYKDSSSIDELRIAAVLHDTVEDTDVTLADIAERFGYMVAALVEELSSDKKKQNEMGKTEYLKQKMAKMSSYALVIKLCDRLDNVLDLKLASAIFRGKYLRETKDIIGHLLVSRKLTDTHCRIIDRINEEIESHERGIS